MKSLLIVIFLVLMLNIPFGYWRINVKRFSLQWFLAIHIPVPFIIALRIFTDIGFEWQSYVFLVASFFVGQKIGGLIHKYLDKMGDVGSCLVMDLKRIISHH